MSAVLGADVVDDAAFLTTSPCIGWRGPVHRRPASITKSLRCYLVRPRT